MKMHQMIQGTALYTFKSGGQDTLDFKLLFKGSKFMVAESEGLTEILSKGLCQTLTFSNHEFWTLKQ